MDRFCLAGASDDSLRPLGPSWLIFHKVALGWRCTPGISNLVNVPILPNFRSCCGFCVQPPVRFLLIQRNLLLEATANFSPKTPAIKIHAKQTHYAVNGILKPPDILDQKPPRQFSNVARLKVWFVKILRDLPHA
ncbi:MAG: hypothetical protein P4N60_08755 [Verrucomicrobiae bacterium]|nr:hypothetical protein [Verrucomicrobiae bacterium]